MSLFNSFKSVKRIIFFFLGILLISLLVYYFAFRNFEYEVNFRTTTWRGDVVQTLRIWSKSLEKSKINSVDSIFGVQQEIRVDSHDYRFLWQLSRHSDSITDVSVQVSENGNEFINKMLVPFMQSRIEIDSKELVTSFYQILKEHLKITKVKIDGLSYVDSANCICRRVRDSQANKASVMMREYQRLIEFIVNNEIISDGQPRIYVKSWSHGESMLEFDFCFPVRFAPPKIGEKSDFFFKKAVAMTALRATYNGNYITSDRAWYRLVEYANISGYEISNTPIEIFFNNPNLGGNEIEWTTEVYFPLKEQKKEI
jgi:effector-binding domain-containing protein